MFGHVGRWRDPVKMETMERIAIALGVLAFIGLVIHAMTPTPPAHTRTTPTA